VPEPQLIAAAVAEEDPAPVEPEDAGLLLFEPQAESVAAAMRPAPATAAYRWTFTEEVPSL
jgi:hypothetical protein